MEGIGDECRKELAIITCMSTLAFGLVGGETAGDAAAKGDKRETFRGSGLDWVCRHCSRIILSRGLGMLASQNGGALALALVEYGCGWLWVCPIAFNYLQENSNQMVSG